MYSWQVQTTDGGLLEGLKREKNEEIGPGAKIRICYTMSCYQVWYTKNNGSSMILSHHIAIYEGGEIRLNPDGYADYKWVPVEEIEAYDQIPANPPAVRAALRYLPLLTDDDFAVI